MGKTVRRIVILIICIILLVSSAHAKLIRDIYKESKQSIALILTYDSRGMPLAIGSGFFIEADKLVTNYHVIDGASTAVVRTIGSERQHNVKETISYSEGMDIAILLVDIKRKPLHIKATQDQQIGDKVVAIGNPKGLEGSVSEGIISGLRKVDDFKVYQITAPISPGSSGGPLFDLQGNVIGITTASIIEGQNLNFAIPVLLVDRLKKSGKRWEPAKTGRSTSFKPTESGLSFVEFARKWIWTGGQIEYSLKNNTKQTIKNPVYVLMFFDKRSKEMLHFSIFSSKVLIPPGMSKRFVEYDKALNNFSSKPDENATHVIYAEFRIITYEIEERTKPAVLDFLQK